MKKGEGSERGTGEERAGGTTPRLITRQTRMGEIIERWPEVVPLLVASGFTHLADPAHRAIVKGLPVTVEMACARHGANLEEVLERLNATAGR